MSDTPPLEQPGDHEPKDHEPSDDDVFAALTKDLNFDTPFEDTRPEDVGPQATGPQDTAQPPELDAAFGDVPEDLSELHGKTEFAALITQIAAAEPLAAACSLAGVDIDAVPTDVGAVAVLRDPSGDEPATAAAALTSLVKGVPLIAVARRSGQLTMTRWQDGAAGDELPAGLVLGGAPEALEDLLFGTIPAGEFPGVVASSAIGRFKAMRILATQARHGKKP